MTNQLARYRRPLLCFIASALRYIRRGKGPARLGHQVTLCTGADTHQGDSNRGSATTGRNNQ